MTETPDLPELIERSPEDWSSVTYRVHTCPVPSDPEPDPQLLYTQILIVSFEGECGRGDAATPDCVYMVAAIHSALALCDPAALVLDLSALTFEQGDRMASVLYANYSPRSDVEVPLAVVVSDRCRAGLTALLRDEMDIDPTEFLVDDLAAALAKIDSELTRAP